jgi:hypothetical protein
MKETTNKDSHSKRQQHLSKMISSEKSTYNYVLLVDTQHMEQFVYRDLHNLANVRILCKERLFSSRLLSLLFHISFSRTFKNHCPSRLKSVWFPWIVKQCLFDNDNPVVFIFCQGWHDETFLFWLKRNHPEIRTVLFLDDTVAFFSRSLTSFDPYVLHDEYAVVLSYNPEDVTQYGLIQSPVFFSRIPRELIPQMKHVDLVFVGYAKDRLPFIREILHKMGTQVACGFYVVDDTNERHVTDGLVYLHKQMPYLSYLGYETSANCILEILKGDTKGCSYRVWEAVYYNKKLLTNWKGIFSFPFYNPKFMRYFETADDIDVEFVRSKEPVDYGYKGENSPIHLLENLDRILDGDRIS